MDQQAFDLYPFVQEYDLTVTPPLQATWTNTVSLRTVGAGPAFVTLEQGAADNLLALYVYEALDASTTDPTLVRRRLTDVNGVDVSAVFTAGVGATLNGAQVVLPELDQQFFLVFTLIDNTLTCRVFQYVFVPGIGWCAHNLSGVFNADGNAATVRSFRAFTNYVDTVYVLLQRVDGTTDLLVIPLDNQVLVNPNITLVTTGLAIDGTLMSANVACDKQTVHVTYVNAAGNQTLTQAFEIDATPATTPLTTAQVLLDSAFPVAPRTLRLPHEDGIFTVFATNREKENVLRTAVVMSGHDGVGNLSSTEVPHNANLNKATLFQEANDTSQRNRMLDLVGNVNNNQFSYLCYVTSTNELRVIKLYHHYDASNASRPYTTMLAWATRTSGLIDFEQVAAAEDTDSALARPFELVMASDGRLWLWTRVNTVPHVHLIGEHSVDLGHAVGGITAPVTTVNTLLEALRDFSLDATKRVVLQSTATDTQTFETTLTLNFNANIVADPDLTTDVTLLVQTALRTLYRNSNIPLTGTGFTVTTAVGGRMDITVPRGTTARPCVVSGTEVMLYAGGTFHPLPVDTVRENDLIMNQDGRPVRVLRHLTSRIMASAANAPYVIPVNFFGETMPYKPLLISGDHAMLAGPNDRVFPTDIDVLQQVGVGTTVTYHHLLLENDSDNYYVANGLPVDSYHVGGKMF